MSLSSSRSPRARSQLGSPVIPINSPGVYLRHRVAAAAASRARNRAKWMRRLCWIAAAAAFYFVIGRDLIAMTQAITRAGSTTVRHDAQAFTKTLDQAIKLRQSDPESLPTAPLAFTSPAGLAQERDPASLDSVLAQDPIETSSRLR